MNSLTILRDKSLASRFGRASDGEVKWAAEKLHFETLCRSNPRILECEPDTVRSALLDAAYSGLTLSPSAGLAYLIPRAMRRGGTPHLQFSPSYRGLVHMVEKAGTIRSLQAVVVRDRDEFTVFVDDNKRQIRHVEAAPNQRGKLVAVYVIVTLATGDTVVEVMDEAAIQGCKDSAARFNGGKIPFTWSGKFEEEMWKKAVIRRAVKLLPRDPAGMLDKAVEVITKADPHLFEGEVEEVREPVETMSVDDMNELKSIVAEKTGLPDDRCDMWLERTAQAMGYGGTGNVPKDKVGPMRSRLIDRIEVWKKVKEERQA